MTKNTGFWFRKLTKGQNRIRYRVRDDFSIQCLHMETVCFDFEFLICLINF